MNQQPGGSQLSAAHRTQSTKRYVVVFIILIYVVLIVQHYLHINIQYDLHAVSPVCEKHHKLVATD